ncbi:iron chelate uptake ABC transporter family permease subunit [Arthrobacter zhaoxinii]|uniref:Iron chelate uptake ABC transporter family permease subunit n=1 Tax=Arthrobacter zhaoxinii TaxID=2964616 RepID=A0ABY5YQY5_9MICC|nr:iron chelate uptake ABC transporter family permease subunit [Arthrobacter zhaoxinii]UWX96454.1 iron chelate uptake ABC transporter family permease subunit [Arthrobacter zhaoxinii]
MPETSTNALPAALTGHRRHPVRTVPAKFWIITLGIAAAALIAVFMTIELRGNLGYALPRRAVKVGSMILVAYAVGVSTVLFQTVTANRILTPSIMGFDALYVLIQTVLVFTLGGGALLSLGAPVRFCLEVLLMVGFSFLLYRWLFTGGGKSLHLMLLVGIVFGTMFRGFSSLLQVLIDPSEFIILQDLFFASFNNVDAALLGYSAAAVALVSALAWRMRHSFDVLALGRDTAVNLGVDHKRAVTLTLIICSVLVAVSTALVGPVTFFGLLVASLAYQLCANFRHAAVLPIAVLLGIIALVGGQLVLERIFDFDTALSIVIEFVGGIVFLVLLLRGKVK